MDAARFQKGGIMVILITIGVFLIVSGLLADGLLYVADPTGETNGN